LKKDLPAMFGFSKVTCRTAAAILLLAALGSAVHAQTDDEASPTAPSVSQPPRPPLDNSIRGHGGGGDDDTAALPSFRDDRGPNAGMRLEATPGIGLALDTSPLPGELGDTPEGGRTLFEKPSQGLSMRPDPWTISPKP